MKRHVLTAAVALALTPMAVVAQESWFGFSQITAEAGEGVGTPYLDNGDLKYSNDGLQFGADRIRIGYRATEGIAFGKLQVDFMQTGTDANNFPNVIKDAVVGIDLGDPARVSLGHFKTPVGMDFNTSGASLDITKRGLEKPLVLERAAGAMVSGRNLGGGFGYDVGVFNPAVRSGAVQTSNVGEDQAGALRLMYDMADMLHVEASYGVSENAGGGVIGSETEDYTVYAIGGAWFAGPLTVKGEYVSGTNVRGRDLDEDVWYLHGGYRFMGDMEAVLRHYDAEAENNNGTATLTNTYVGLNWFVNEAARVQVNYVVAGGDNDDIAEWQAGTLPNNPYRRTAALNSGYLSDALLAQFQYRF